MKIRRSNLCETWAHSSRAADTHRHSSLAETLSKWFMFKYSNRTQALHSTFIKWMPKGLPVSYTRRNRAQDGCFFTPTIHCFLCYSCLYQKKSFCNVAMQIYAKEDLYYRGKVNTQLIATVFFMSIMAPSFSQYKYYSSFITEHGLALQNFSSGVVKIIQSHAELPVVCLWTANNILPWRQPPGLVVSVSAVTLNRQDWASNAVCSSGFFHPPSPPTAPPWPSTSSSPPLL